MDNANKDKQTASQPIWNQNNSNKLSNQNGQQEIAREGAIKILRQSQTQQGLIDSV